MLVSRRNQMDQTTMYDLFNASNTWSQFLKTESNSEFGIHLKGFLTCIGLAVNHSQQIFNRVEVKPF